MSSTQQDLDAATQRRAEMEAELAGMGAIEEAADPGAWIRRRADLLLAVKAARAQEIRAQLAEIEAERGDWAAQQPDARAHVQELEEELAGVQERLREARRHAGSIQFQMDIRIDRRRRLETELAGILAHLRDQAESPVVRARNVAH